MKIAAVVSVKDEVDLIDRCLAHLRTIGVDAIIACDKGSTDGTLERLDAHRGDPDFMLVEVSDREGHEQWTAKNMELLAQVDADWVTFLDGDEFLITASGRLADCAGLDGADVVSVDRFNVPLSAKGPLLPDVVGPDQYDELLLVAEPIPSYWDHLEREPDTSWMRAEVAARVIARPRCIGTIGYGTHNVFPPEGAAPLRRVRAKDVFVAHVPTTTWPRFEHKVENIRQFLITQDAELKPSDARHWRRWAAMADAGTLRAEFDRLIFDDAMIADLCDRSVIRSASRIFADRTGSR